jgi:hypothetical protein
MIPEKDHVQYLYDCRCCRRRKVGRIAVAVDYGRTVAAVVGMFDKGVRLVLCEGCTNLAVHDLIAISRASE